jgi:hypothetical protein
MTARLVTPDSSVQHPKLCDEDEDILTGSVVSSLHRLKDVDNQGKREGKKKKAFIPLWLKGKRRFFFFLHILMGTPTLIL